MGAFTDMLLPDKGSGQDAEKADQDDEGEPVPGTARHREFYPEGVADVLKVILALTYEIFAKCAFRGMWFSIFDCLYHAQGEWVSSGKEVCESSKLFHLYMYNVRCVDFGSSKDPFLSEVSEFAILFGNELDAEVVVSLSMDLSIRI